MLNRERLIAAIARDQGGVFTLQQAVAAGLSARAVRDRVRRGTFERIHPGVFGYPGSGDDWHRRVFAAVLSASLPAAASHRTAALLWGLTDRTPDFVEIVARRHKRVHRGAFAVHESKDLVDSDIVTVDGIPTTTAVRTVVDLGASARPRFVERCLDTGLRKKLFTAWEVRCFVARVARPGRTGVGTIRPLVEERLLWGTITDSDLEDLFRSVVSPLPFPMPDLQYRLFDPDGAFVGRFDFAYPPRNALIETDSEGWHMDPVSFQRDREKQNRAHALGWTVYRFTWRQLMDDPESVREIIRQIWTD
ncbi:MAG: type IV toxin-antitoxin system AbiEi family antitoxin domain-containing protein [Actinomycetota bacterium]